MSVTDSSPSNEAVVSTPAKIVGGGMVQHAFERKIVVTRAPTVLFTVEVLEDIRCIVHSTHNEVGWLALAHRINPNDRYSDIVVDRVLLPKQDVHGATCELDPEGINEITNELLSEPNGVDLVNSIRVWGHSHVNMGTSPSGQDVAEFQRLARHCDDFFIRIIANKKGRMEVCLDLIDIGVHITDIPWHVYNVSPIDHSEMWSSLVRDRVRTMGYTSGKWQGGAYTPNSGVYGGGAYRASGAVHNYQNSVAHDAVEEYFQSRNGSRRKGAKSNPDDTRNPDIIQERFIWSSGGTRVREVKIPGRGWINEKVLEMEQGARALNAASESPRFSHMPPKVPIFTADDDIDDTNDWYGGHP